MPGKLAGVTIASVAFSIGELGLTVIPAPGPGGEVRREHGSRGARLIEDRHDENPSRAGEPVFFRPGLLWLPHGSGRPGTRRSYRWSQKRC